MGRRGGRAAIAVSAVAFAIFFTLVWLSFQVHYADVWGPGLIRAVALIVGAGASAYAFTGVRLLTREEYPHPSEIFPPLPRDEFIFALLHRPEPICACTECRVIIPALYSTGQCPVCTSTVSYYEVRNDEDARLILSGLPGYDGAEFTESAVLAEE